MKGLILLFLAIVLFGISWQYIDTPSRKVIQQFVRSNFWIVAVALLAVSAAVFFSVNTTLRLV